MTTAVTTITPAAMPPYRRRSGSPSRPEQQAEAVGERQHHPRLERHRVEGVDGAVLVMNHGR